MAPPLPIAPQAKNLLLLEDDAFFGEFLTEFLRRGGYRVTHVGNGLEGMDALGREPFDAVVCDFVLPGLSGDRFYERAVRMRPELGRRFVFITGRLPEAEFSEVLREAGSPLLRKPFPIDDLFRALAGLDA